MKYRALHYEGTRLESPGRKVGSEKGSNGRKGKQKELVDRKRALAGKVEGLYSGKEQGTFKKKKNSQSEKGGYQRWYVS